MSLYSAHFLRQVPTLLQVEGEEPPDPQFHEGGYLFLASPEGVATLRENYDIQRSVGAAVELLGVEELGRRYPWLNTEGVELASLGKYPLPGAGFKVQRSKCTVVKGLPLDHGFNYICFCVRSEK